MAFKRPAVNQNLNTLSFQVYDIQEGNFTHLPHRFFTQFDDGSTWDWMNNQDSFTEKMRLFESRRTEKWNQMSAVVFYGVTDHGNSVACFCKFPLSFRVEYHSSVTASVLITSVRDITRSKKSIDFTVERKPRQYGWKSDPDDPRSPKNYNLLHIRANSILRYNELLYAFKELNKTTKHVIEIHEDRRRYPTQLKAIIATGVNYGSWVTVPNYTTKARLTSCDYEIVVSIGDLKIDDKNVTTAPFSIAAVDIECDSPSGRFPNAENISDQITMIGVMYKGRGLEKNYLFRQARTHLKETPCVKTYFFDDKNSDPEAHSIEKRLDPESHLIEENAIEASLDPDHSIESHSIESHSIEASSDAEDNVKTKKDSTMEEDYAKNGIEYEEHIVDNERNLLCLLHKFIMVMDPQIIMTFNGDMFDWKYILLRTSILEIPANYFCNLGVLFQTQWEDVRNHDEILSPVVASAEKNVKVPFCNVGRVGFDIRAFFQGTMAGISRYRFKKYSLNAVAERLVGAQKLDVSAQEMFRIWKEGTIGELRHFCNYCMVDVILLFNIIENESTIDQLVAMASTSHTSIHDTINKGQFMKVKNMTCVRSANMGLFVNNPFRIPAIEIKVQTMFLYLLLSNY